MKYNLKNFLECGCSYCRKYKENMKTELRKRLKNLEDPELKKKTWNNWNREYVLFQKERDLIKEILGEAEE